MTKVLAAIDGTSMSRGVLVVGTEVARVLGAEAEAIHVVEGRSTGDAQAEARREGSGLRLLEGPVVSTLVAAASETSVDAVVVGLRRASGASRPAGRVAMSLITRARTPVVVVPPTMPSEYRLRKVVVPIQGRPAQALGRVIRLARDASLDMVVVHVHDEGSIPSFEDQPHYDVEAWADEFLTRWVPGARRGAVVEVRVGAPGQEIVGVTRESGADLIAMGWRQDLTPGRATTVRAVLMASHVPVLLLPVVVAQDPSHGVAAGTRLGRA